MTVLDDTRDIRRNKGRIVKQIKEIDTAVDYFKKKFNIDTENVDPEAQIFQTLDRMKARMTNAKFTVNTYGDSDKRAVPVDIELPVKNYSALVRYVQYVESFRIPSYEINYFSVRENDSKTMILRLQGKFLMPDL
jgi:hypothetical protein